MSARSGALLDPADLAGVLAAVPYTKQLIDTVRTNVAATDTTSGNTELNLARLAMPGVLLENGFVYQLDLSIVNNRGTSATDEFEFKLRRDTALNGTPLGSDTSWAESSTTGRTFRGRILFTANASATGVDLFLSVARVSGTTGTMTIQYGNFGTATRTMCQLWRIAPSTSLREIIV